MTLIIDKSKRYVVRYTVLPDIDKTVVFFLASPKNNNIIPQANEIKEVLWVELNKNSIKLFTFK